jgi:nicotinate-nucleotide adenylyltransferase
MRELRAELGPAHPVACLIGADAFRGLTEWHGWRELFTLGHLVALTRPGHCLDALDPVLEEALRVRRCGSPAALSASSAGCVLELAVPAWEVSSTQVRAALAQGHDLQRWVPRSVLDWIAANQVYARPLQGA